MMGPAKLSTIRKEMREALKMSDSDLLDWFAQTQDRLASKPDDHPTEIDTLRLHRDALLQERKRTKSKRGANRPKP
jgi:hypothetical protein